MPDRLYEAHLEPDEGWHLPGGEKWRGYRVRYRPVGTRRWFKFVLVDQDATLSVEELQRVCDAHFTKAKSGVGG